MDKIKIAVAGSHGFIGSHLMEYLSNKYQVSRISRNSLYNNEILLNELNEVDVVINLAGVMVAKPWTKKNKKRIMNSRVTTTKNLVDVINVINNRSIHLINASAIGIYKSERCYTEEDVGYDNNFLAKVVDTWEREVKRISSNHMYTITRFGNVMGDGGYLEKISIGFKMGFNVTLGSGKQFFSYIHMEDAVKAIEFVINKKMVGIVNVTNDEMIRIHEVNKIISRYYGGKLKIRIPEKFLKAAIGEQRVLFTEGQCVIPKRLIDAGFQWKYNNFEKTIAAIKRKNS